MSRSMMMTRSFHKFGWLALVMSGLSAGACGDDNATDPQVSEIMPALEIKNGKGQVFLRHHKIPDLPVVRDVNGRVKVRPPKGPDRDYGRLSDAELAEVLSPRMARDGYEYRLKEVDMELVRHVRRTNRADIVSAADPTKAPELDGIPEELSGKKVIGADGRVLHRNNTTFPHSAQVYSTQGCSGTMIARSTMVTAAHCVHSGSDFFRWPAYRPGADIQDATPYPYGSLTCYDVTVPGGWDGDTVSEDYAVIEFGTRCGSYPGDSTSWIPFFATDSGSKITGRTNYIYGYPGDKSPYPQIWGMGNTSMTTSVWYPARLFYNIDTFDGQSGSGVYQLRDGVRYLVGIHSGGYDSDENQARWFDTTVAAFVRKYSAL